MFERDYLMRLLVEFAAGIQRVIERAGDHLRPEESAQALDDVVGRSVDMDADALLSLSPESLAAVLEVSGVDPRLGGHIARSLLLSSQYYAEAGADGLSQVRAEQAQAVAAFAGHELPADGQDAAALLEEVEQDIREA